MGLNQLQQVGKYLSQEEVGTASVDHSFKKLRGKEGKGKRESSGESREVQGRAF